MTKLKWLDLIGSLANWASNGMITKSVSVHQCQPSSSKVGGMPTSKGWRSCYLKNSKIAITKLEIAISFIFSAKRVRVCHPPEQVNNT